MLTCSDCVAHGEVPLSLCVCLLAQAVDALRLCVRQTTMIANQTHCIKNSRHLIVSIIEHVVTQVGHGHLQAP